MATLFPEETWKSIYSSIATAFRMDAVETGRLASSPVAKLIAAIPYLAGCRNPQRAALAHLGTYVIGNSEAGRAAFDHAKGDDYDVMARFAMGVNFEGGEPAVIARGMKTLACIMIQGYERDVESDIKKGIYNPVASRAWDPAPKLAQLRAEIAATSNPEMDGIASATMKDPYWED